MPSSAQLPAVAARDALTLRLRLAAAVARCPLALLYEIAGERARLVGAFGAPAQLARVSDEVAAWRLARAEMAVVQVIGRGPAAPESAVLPTSFGVAALISAPITRNGKRVGTLLLADNRARADWADLDCVALSTVRDLLGELLIDETDEDTGIRRADSLPIEEQSLPPDLGDLAAWPIAPGGHDPVTGLPDRLLLTHSAGLALEEARMQGASIAVAILALDRFQRIDDWLGRDVGDELLRQVSERLLETTNETDLVGRGNGDEFVVVLTRLGAGRSASARADRMLQAIREPFHVHGYELSLSATIGLSRFPDDASDPATLLRYAGIALHRAKGRQRGRLEHFTPELKEAVEQRGEVERRLRHAIGAGELVLHYQPRVDLHTKQTTGVEALLRWMRGGTVIAPGAFLPVAEESELIVPIGTWAMLDACRQMRRWLDSGVPLQSVSVNVSALQFARRDFVGTIERTLKTTRLSPEHLELEITETSLMDDVGAAVERLTALRKLGVRVSVDDFGTGYSSLAYLQRLPLDVLKIDRSFVKELDASGSVSAHAHALTHAIAALGKSLGLRVLAEGVETAAQLEAVRALGCDEVQGFFFARPMPPREIESYLRD